MSNTIEVKLVETNFFTRWPCTICGGCTEKVNVLAEAETPDGAIRVCETCLKAGNIDDRLEWLASDFEDQAAHRRDLKGRLKVPTYEEWLAREKRVDVANYAAYQTDDPAAYGRVLNDDASFKEWAIREKASRRAAATDLESGIPF